MRRHCFPNVKPHTPSILQNLCRPLFVSCLFRPHGIRSKLTGAMPINFYYSVVWHESEISVEDALKTQLLNMVQSNKDSMEIRWLPIINSFVLVVIIVSVLALIMFRVIKADLNAIVENDEGTCYTTKKSNYGFDYYTNSSIL